MYNEITDEILNIDDVCEILCIGKNTAYSLLKSGELKGFQCGKSWKIPKVSIIKYIKEKSFL